jgi:excisionase family DNA binding protein
MDTFVERHFRPSEAATLSGLTLATWRRWILERRVGYRKAGRCVLIPESEVRRMLGELRPAIGNGHGNGHSK